MRLWIVTAAFAAFVATPVFAAGNTGAGKARPPPRQYAAPAPAGADAAAQTMPETTSGGRTRQMRCRAVLIVWPASAPTTPPCSRKWAMRKRVSPRAAECCAIASTDSNNAGVFVTKGKTVRGQQPLASGGGAMRLHLGFRFGTAHAQSRPALERNLGYGLYRGAGEESGGGGSASPREETKNRSATSRPQPQQQQQPDLTFQPVIP